MAALAAADGNDEAIEMTLCMIPACFVFKLPPRVRADGWLAAEMTEQMWSGKLRVAQRGERAVIFLTDKDNGSLFAACPIEKGSVDRVKDSSRYFVLKIQNAQGKHAFIGLAFNDRNDAFDFNVALQAFEKEKQRAAIGPPQELSKGPSADYSIKQGEKITIHVPGSSSRRQQRAAASGGGGGLKLAPPPGDTPSVRKLGGGLLAPPPGDTPAVSAPLQQQQNSPSLADDSLLSLQFVSATPQQQQQQQHYPGMTSAAPPPASSDPFSGSFF